MPRMGHATANFNRTQTIELRHRSALTWSSVGRSVGHVLSDAHVSRLMADLYFGSIFPPKESGCFDSICAGYDYDIIYDRRQMNE